MKYSDNLSTGDFCKLLVILAYKYNQPLSYYNRCARRVGRYARKNLAVRDWPTHIKNQYHFIVKATESIPKGDLVPPPRPGVVLT